VSVVQVNTAGSIAYLDDFIKTKGIIEK